MKGFVRGLAALLVVAAFTAQAQDKTTLATDKEKVSYMIGMDVAESNAPAAPDVDIAAFERAVRNGFAKKPPLIDEATASKTAQALMTRIGARSSGQGTLPDVSKENVGLLIGTEAGKRLVSIQDEIDVPTFVQAVRTSFAKGKLLLTSAEADIVRNGFSERMNARFATQAQQVAADNAKKGADFLATNAKQKGVFTTKSGLQYMILRQGSGLRPKPGERVKVLYTGSLLDGTVFDATDDGQPRTFSLAQVIAGWSEGLSMMPIGGKYRFWIPGPLAYGEAGPAGSPIGPNATLVFDVELLGVE